MKILNVPHRLVLFFFLCISIKGSCQSKCDCFDRLYRLANNQTDTLSSIKILKDALTFLSPERRGDYYWEVAQSYYLLKQYDSAAKWYGEAAVWGYDIDYLKLYAPEVYKRIDTNKVDMALEKNRGKVDPELYKMFATQLEMDQGVRTGKVFSVPGSGDSLIPVHDTSIAKRIMQKVDDSTFRFLKWVFQKYGFPTYHQLGFYPRGMSAMILHVTASRPEQATCIINKLKEFSDQCKYQRSSLLFLMDRRKYYYDKKSYCGLIGAGQRYLYIEDIGKADSIRFAYNQVRLKEEAASWGGELPPGYKPRPYPKNYFCLKKYEIK